eukprot:TRINITY_DN9182_c0_g3_i1.p1 TRINITY_DN9182_c0_g3~~TRINITY_DN9182_c0_g3_i1.p1  ORF type:complete len:389 (+),score=79.14 TRINITY_DN9182_c0_g3_i1:95-1261(+)
MSRFVHLILFVASVLALDNGLGLTPPLGFNTWNHFGCNINETIIYDTIDAIVNLGLRELGYIYVNIDDCWMEKSRGHNDELVYDRKRFPNGIKVLADYAHQQGLKLGIYSSAGALTCQKLAASLGKEYIDAITWANWGIDYLKYDNCNHNGISAYERYTRMRDALNKTGRYIYYSICNWGQEDVWEWGPAVGNSWRTTGDIRDYFDSVRDIYEKNVRVAKFGKKGGWNDPDMLEVGNGGMTVTEYKTHFTLWAMAKSPLLIGCDLKKIKSEHLEILKNKDIIALNQDRLGIQAECVLNCEGDDFSSSAENAQVTILELEENKAAIAVTNWNDDDDMSNIKLQFSRLPLKRSVYQVKDLWSKAVQKNITELVVDVLKPHETKVYLLTPP